MERFGAFLKAERERRGLKQAEVAKAAAISQPYLSRLEAGGEDYRQIGHDVLRKLAAVFDTTDDALEALVYDRPLPRTLPATPEMTREIPIVADLSAGAFGGAVDGYEYIGLSETRGRMLRAGRVTGSCMAPAIQPGDVIIFDAANRSPNDGQVVVATIPDSGSERGRGVIKRFYRLGDKIKLEPNVGEPIILNADDVRVEGVVVEARRRF